MYGLVIPILNDMGLVKGLCIVERPFWFPKNIPEWGDSGEFAYLLCFGSFDEESR